MWRVGRAHIRVIAPAGNRALFEEKLQRWRAVSNTVSDLTGPRFEPQTSRLRDERVIARLTGWLLQIFQKLIMEFTSLTILLERLLLKR